MLETCPLSVCDLQIFSPGMSFLHSFLPPSLPPFFLFFLPSFLPFFFFLSFLFIYYFWLCWVFVSACRLSLVVASVGYSSLWCAGFLLWWLLVAEHGLQACGLQQLWLMDSVVVAHRLSSCGSWALEHRLSSSGTRAQLLHGMWDLPGQGLEPVSPSLAGGFLTTVPPGKPPVCLFIFLTVSFTKQRVLILIKSNLKFFLL